MARSSTGEPLPVYNAVFFETVLFAILSQVVLVSAALGVLVMRNKSPIRRRILRLALSILSPAGYALVCLQYLISYTPRYDYIAYRIWNPMILFVSGIPGLLFALFRLHRGGKEKRAIFFLIAIPVTLLLSSIAMQWTLKGSFPSQIYLMGIARYEWLAVYTLCPMAMLSSCAVIVLSEYSVKSASARGALLFAAALLLVLPVMLIRIPDSRVLYPVFVLAGILVGAAIPRRIKIRFPRRD